MPAYEVRLIRVIHLRSSEGAETSCIESGLRPGAMIGCPSSDLVAVEVANALRKYGLAKEVTAEVRAIFSLGLEVYRLDATDVREAAEIFLEAYIGPYDCAHAAIMRRNGLKEIISADQEFDKINWLKRLDSRSVED